MRILRRFGPTLGFLENRFEKQKLFLCTAIQEYCYQVTKYGGFPHKGRNTFSSLSQGE